MHLIFSVYFGFPPDVTDSYSVKDLKQMLKIAAEEKIIKSPGMPIPFG